MLVGSGSAVVFILGCGKELLINLFGHMPTAGIKDVTVNICDHIAHCVASVALHTLDVAIAYLLGDHQIVILIFTGEVNFFFVLMGFVLDQCLCDRVGEIDLADTALRLWRFEY